MDQTLEDLRRPDARQPVADGAIVERIVAAVMEQKLPPGAKLPEIALCEAFNVSRTQIRRILVVLSERGVVTLHANRGAFVSSPGAEEARDVFEARRALERSIVVGAVGRIDQATLENLRAISQAGAAAEAEGARRESISLSGQFHIKLAEAAGNAVMTRFLEDLVARTSLIIGLYGSRHGKSCSESEHEAILDALAARDAERAAGLMEAHLAHIETSLDIRDVSAEPADIRRILAG